jgi:hypothetical protein
VLPLLIDENLDQRILRGVRLRLPRLDYVVTQDEPAIAGLADPALLSWAAEQGRILVTHDANTIPRFAYERVDSGLPMPGVIIIPEDLGIGVAIEELCLAAECGEPGDFEGQVRYVPY